LQANFKVYLHICYSFAMEDTESSTGQATEESGSVEPAMTTAVELRGILGSLKRRLRQEYNAGDFTVSQLSVLGHLDRKGPATVTSLAKADGMRPQSMGATVAALEAAGLVTGSPDPSDGRQTVISITPFCREKIAASRAAKEDWLFRSIKGKLNAAEQEQLACAISLLKRLVEE
jgi:DNA-binding MarR family transcriptional regulator